MITSQVELLLFLDEQQIHYQLVEHPPVFTCEEAERLRPDLDGVSTKNLFLNDRQGNFYLLVTDCAKRLDLKQLGKQIGASKLHFGSEEMLMELLGLTRGAVTMLGLVNDAGQRVKLLIDQDIWGKEYYLCHPLVNTATLIMQRTDLERFVSLTRHIFTLCQIESKG